MEAYITEAETYGDQFVVLFSGCDYKCPFCNTPHLVEFQTGEVQETREVMRLMEKSPASSVFFSGGEPLLQRQALLELLHHAKSIGKKGVIDTNGSKPEAIKQLLEEGLVDEFIVDVKAPAESFGKVTKAATFFKPARELYDEFLQSLQHLRESKATITFKTLITPGLLYKKEEILGIASLLDGFDAEWLLLSFSPERVLDSTLKGVSPPTTRFLETLASFVRKKYPAMRIRTG